MTTAKFKGTLSSFLQGLNSAAITVTFCVGTTIYDRNGKRVGEITEICYEDDIFRGELSVDSLEGLGQLWSKGLSINSVEEATYEK